MFKKVNDYICISLGDDILKAVHIKGGSHLKVENIIVRDVKGLDDAGLVKTLQSSMNNLKGKGARVVCVVPHSLTTTKNIEIPSINNEEIKSIVSLQAGRHTPFSREEIQIGYINIGVYKTNYTKVLLVIANKNILKKQLDVFKKAGLQVSKVLFAPEGISHLYSEALGLKDDAIPAGIIDIGNQTTDFIVTLRGLAITTRSIPIGKNHLKTEGEAAQSKLIEELKLTISAYQNEDIDQIPGKYFITSDDATIRELQTEINKKLNWITDIATYVDILKVSKGVLRQLAEDMTESSLLDVIAPISVVEEAQVNLIPEDLQILKTIEDKTKEVFMASSLSVLTLILIACALGLKIYFKEDYLKRMAQKYEENRQEVLTLEDMDVRTKIVKTFIENRMVSLDTIRGLYKSVPTQVYLTNLVMDEKGNVSIQGISDIASIVFNLVTTLKESEQFKSVDIKSQTSKKDRGKDVAAFEITLKLKSAPDEEAADATQIKE